MCSGPEFETRFGACLCFEPLVRAEGYGIPSTGPMRLLGNDVGPPLCIWTKLDKGYSLSGKGPVLLAPPPSQGYWVLDEGRAS